MDEANGALIERYQMMLQQDPQSKVFAPLAEAYRKMGMLDEAERICNAGVLQHPQFPSGRVAMAKILLEKKNTEKAVEHLKAAVELSSENILAHTLLADSLMELKRPREALRSFKMVMFLNPKDERAQKTIKKLEALTAGEYESEIFQMKKLPDPKFGTTTDAATKQRTLERFISLADAYTVRNDAEKAMETLTSAENVFGAHPEIERRQKLLKKRYEPPPPAPEDLELPPPKKSPTVKRLEKLLQQIQERREH
ncbi:MAG: tetratricopeptide repeat protein [Bdellovibrionia bacterium]